MVRLGNGGVIINISSISRAGNVGQSNYTAAKAGVASLVVSGRANWRLRHPRRRIAPGSPTTRS